MTQWIASIRPGISVLSMLVVAASVLQGCGQDEPTPPPPSGVGTATLQVNDACGTGGLAGATVQEGTANVGTTDASGSLQLADVASGQHVYTVGMAAYLPQSVSVTVVTGENATGSANLVCQTKAVGDMARAFTAQIGVGGFFGVTPAATVYGLLGDGIATNDPTVISVRANSAYQLGHVPGAINIPWKNVADDPVALLGQPFDASRTFVDYCYTGHTGAIPAGVLGVLGYKTSNMKYGITSWTTNATVWGAGITLPDYYCDTTKNVGDPLRGPCATNDRPLETTPNVPTTTYELPWLNHPGVTTAWEAARASAKAYLAGAAASIGAADLQALLEDGNPANDPFIVSVRSPTDYAAGHIPGAINIPYSGIADEANLRKIPPDRDVVVYCYTAHTGGVATAVLGMLGYRVKNLRFGIYGWNSSAPGGAPFSANDLHDYQFVTGSSPGTF